jgi:hypothetical protein
MSTNPVLQLDARRTVLRAQGRDDQVSLEVRIGWQDLADVFHDPVSEADIELAIERVEEAIGHPRIDIVDTWDVCAHDTLRRLADAAGLARDPVAALTTEAVEALFTRLARQAAGAVPAIDRLPGDPRFAAVLVLVRELMHHLRVSTLKLHASA